MLINREPDAPASATPHLARTSRATIVVAEDDLATRMLLRQVLSDENFTVVAVSNGVLACEAVRRERPDIVLLDWLMPVMDGRAALEELKADERTRGIPVLMLTTVSQIEERVTALEAGAQDFITKPFEPRDLLARIEQQLQWRHLLAVDANAAFELERIALLTESERRYRTLAEAMPPMVWTANAHGLITYQNRAWYDYTGNTFEHAQTGGWSSVIHPDDRSHFLGAWSTSLANGEPHEVQARLRRASDGTYRWHVARATPVRDAAGAIVEWIGACSDIHDYKLAAESRDILDTMQNLISIRHDDGFVEYLNPQWTNYTGAPVDFALGYGWRNFYHPDDVERLIIEFAECARRGALRNEFELRLLGKDGTYRWFIKRSAVLPPKPGSPRRWIATATDIHDAKRAQQQLAAAFEKEKRIADTLQQAFVPKSLPIVANLRFHAAYIPASNEAQIGGDWYDAFELPDGRVLFSIGDVGGHGVGAAIAMSCARQAIIAHGMYETNPANVLSRVNEALLLQQLTMATAICGYIDPVAMQVRYATAGHPPPILAGVDCEPRVLEHDGIPLGVLSNVAYPTFEVAARAGSMMVLCTDGVLENNRDIIEGERRLLEATKRVVEGAPSDPAKAIHTAIFADTLPADDAAIMTVSFCGDAPLAL